jgi:glyoxylase-like metal-dependent hydrolase (beta-lactamase superfamily II)
MSSFNKIEIPIPFPIRSVNIYFIEDSNPTLIDAGFHSRDSLRMVEDALKKRGARLSDIRRILLTHGHLDHVGLAGKIQQLSGAEIFVHPADRDKCIWDVGIYREKKKEPFLRFFKEAGLPRAVGETISEQMDARFKTFFPGSFEVTDLADNATFSFDDFNLEVVHCPGHTKGSVCFFDRQNGRFFSGDHLLEHITSNPVVELEQRGNGSDFKSLSHYLDSLCRTEDLPIATVLPGHGRVFSYPEKRIAEIRDHHRLRREEILRVLCSAPDPGKGMTLFELTMTVFPQLKAWDIFLGMSETLGHLEILEDRGLIHSRLVDSLRIYEAAR